MSAYPYLSFNIKLLISPSQELAISLHLIQFVLLIASAVRMKTFLTIATGADMV